MQQKLKINLLMSAAALSALVLAAPNANANVITGSIGFGATGVSIDSLNLATATTFTVANPFATTRSGTYASVPLFQSVTFDGFAFNPPIASVTPLWTFDIGPTVYSFDATTVTSSFNSADDEWDIGGEGMAMVTGYADTAGTWNVNLSQSGSSFVFDSSAAVDSVPDGGPTLALLGGAVLGLSAFARKFTC